MLMSRRDLGKLAAAVCPAFVPRRLAEVTRSLTNQFNSVLRRRVPPGK
jgi:hypothetical protein